MKASEIHIGDYVSIMSIGNVIWSDCDWSDDFDKEFKVIGFKNTEDCKYINIEKLLITPMCEIPLLILGATLSNGENTIHPIYTNIDTTMNRNNKIDKILK